MAANPFSPVRSAILVFLATHAANAAAADWPQWRGPDSNAVVPAGDYPVAFSPTENVAWQIDLPGPGSSTPIVTGGTIFVTCEIDGQDAVCGYGADGEERWRQLLGPGVEAKHRNATGANPSPVTDGERVFAYYKSGLLAAVTTSGDVVWRHNLQEEYGDNTLWWDLGTSPLLTPAGVVIAVMQDGDSYLATFDTETGELVWKTPRRFECQRESDQSYTTPALVTLDGRPVIVTWGADHLTGHDAESGEQLFVSGGFNPQDKPMWRSIASATISDGVAVVPFGRGDFLAAVRLGGSGDITESGRLWTADGVGADVPSPIVTGGEAYVLGDRGEVTCVALDSGEKLWSDRLPRGREKFFASPLLAGDLLYCFRVDGTGYTARVGDGLEVLAEHDLGDTVVAQPVPLDGGRLLVRTRERLYLFGGE